MTQTIESIIDGVIGREGRYVNDPRDAGGETNWGITIATARGNGYSGSMRDMPRSAAAEIYRRRYVVGPGFDKIAVLSEAIAAELVDTGVNMGPKVAAGFLQRALNVFNNQGRDYPDISADGAAGPGTRAALKAFLDKRGSQGEKVMLAALNALQGERYISLGEGKQTNEAFEFGWFANRVAA
jgi:lysozyme family protein